MRRSLTNDQRLNVRQESQHISRDDVWGALCLSGQSADVSAEWVFDHITPTSGFEHSALENGGRSQ